MNPLKRVKHFIDEEHGQGTIEYLLIMGGVILAAVMFASTYKKMGYRSVYEYNASVQETQEILCEYLKTYLNVTAC